jgi:hypothetical protein
VERRGSRSNLFLPTLCYTWKMPQSAAQKAWYEKPENKAKTIAAARRRKNKLLRLTNRYKAFCGCANCGEKDPVCLDFHHKDNTKEYDVSKLISLGNIVKLRAEIRKCIVLCANCHRKHHKQAFVMLTASISDFQSERESSNLSGRTNK